ncbi:MULTISPECIES: formate dehydrogenase accessory sulfurtransferase FdhD [unclassified Rhizobium]|uniref:formate dehydrogenase accessory sulfurtransferase FdhD n=1 Tax=unclassified Rhizobium TaxID=2613769 RepID=UPI00146D7AD8|nr:MULTISPECIES: formate dehydrogenase accessory sulfurtransferase FdhD [unclassified Rhizobium]MBD9446764.1 formate dehydrogenase accessory sulfurtransferase FdhD [Rhizobium sp. RHZ01]NMN70516.1 FdhD protein [Rhizobium sp. 57MFTsu3.2]
MSDRPTRLAVKRAARSGGVVMPGERIVPEEVPIAFSYGGSTHAVMMGTPGNLEDFAIGFSLTEGIISDIGQIAAIEIVNGKKGIDVQISLVDEVAAALTARRRSMAGPVGCGLCGIESIEQAVRKVPDVADVSLQVTHRDIVQAISLLNGAQPLHRETRAVHGAGFYVPGKGLLAVREDVGRHNALDKLCGAITRQRQSGAAGIVAVTSRLSVEMVQKAAILGASVLVAISAPTALAIRTAEEAGMTLVALVRGEDFEIFTHPHRIHPGSISDVA